CAPRSPASTPTSRSCSSCGSSAACLRPKWPPLWASNRERFAWPRCAPSVAYERSWRRPPVWVEGGDIHDELLDQLGGVLAPPAAAGGVPRPRPVRVVAYTVGLPVDSPALDDTNHHIKELKDAVKAQDAPKAEVTAQRLRTDLTKVPSEEKKEAEQKATPVLN